ncbi:MAG: hypothetical protein PHQ43_00265 [Dehalococcoidales bacterium]|nr:hypothetical protein [Dehalococcoidales bacterium]
MNRKPTATNLAQEQVMNAEALRQGAHSELHIAEDVETHMDVWQGKAYQLLAEAAEEAEQIRPHLAAKIRDAMRRLWRAEKLQALMDERKAQAHQYIEAQQKPLHEATALLDRSPRRELVTV